MHWITAHVYVSLLALAGFLVVAGAFIVNNSTSEPPTSDIAVQWGGVGGFAFLGGAGYTPPKERYRTEALLEYQNQGMTEYSAIPLLDPVTGESKEAADIDLGALLSQLAPSSGNTNVEGEAETGINVYDFIPSGLLSTERIAQNKSPLQQQLFDYGNRVGGFIQGFDDAHTNMIPVLKDAYADKNDPEKIARAVQIGKDYEKLGAELEEMADIPTSVSIMHAGLARSYKDAGKNMVAKLQTKTDEEFLAAMHKYNNSALEFIRRYVALASYLSAAGVQFSTTDPGAVFTFTAASF